MWLSRKKYDEIIGRIATLERIEIDSSNEEPAMRLFSTSGFWEKVPISQVIRAMAKALDIELKYKDKKYTEAHVEVTKKPGAKK